MKWYANEIQIVDVVNLKCLFYRGFDMFSEYSETAMLLCFWSRMSSLHNAYVKQKNLRMDQGCIKYL